MTVSIKIDRIHEIMYRKGLSKRALAKKAGIGQVTAQQVCSGNRTPSPPVAKKIIDALEVDFDDIFEIDSIKKG